MSAEDVGAKGATANGKRQVGLENAPRYWQTPVERDHHPPGLNRTRNTPQIILSHQVQQWATPTARDWKDGANPSEKAPTNGLLGRQACRSFPPGLTPTGPECQPASIRLSPAFVEWLMGFPQGWTVCAPLGTGQFRWSRLMRSALSSLICAGPEQ